MRNYVIINEINSNTIQGLAINTLPPITKPMMRSQIEEIDGRDGDLVTELGYSAYDKTMEIGLWGNYDIDAIIKYFTGEGTIVFSTEPDKYYYFQILNQIDYEKLLKFKKATVTFHCQPFKYPVEETPLEEQYEYVEATGTDLTLNNTEETIFNKFDLIGNTSQDTTTGKNLFNINTNAGYGITFDNDLLGTTSALSSWGISSIYPKTRLDTTSGVEYYFSADIRVKSGTYAKSLNYLRMKNADNYATYTAILNPSLTNEFKKVCFKNVFSGDGQLEYIYLQVKEATDVVLEVKNIMITTSSDTTYEPYTGGIPAPNPDFPEDIHVVSGDNDIEICGKNLFDGELEQGARGNSNGNPFASNQYVRTINPISVSSSTTYTLSALVKNSLSTGGDIHYLDENKNFISRDSLGLTSTKTTPNNCQYINLQYYGFNGITPNDIYNIQIEKGSTATTYEPYTGATYPINLGVENLWKPIPSATKNGVTLTYNDDGSYTLNGTSTAATSFYTTVSYPIGTYSLSANNSQVMLGGADYLLLETVAGGSANKTLVFSIQNHSQTYDITSPITAVVIVISSGKTYNNFVIKPQLEKGSKVNSFSKYGTTPLEMCSIPNTDYKDTFVHEDNKWYKREVIGKLLINGQWISSSNYTGLYTLQNSASGITYNSGGFCDYFQYNNGNIINNDTAYNLLSNNQIALRLGNDAARDRLYIKTDIVSSNTELQTWFSNNNATLYYVLANPTQTEITNETLKAQLDDLWENAISYKGQTNITQTNNDMPFILDVSALELGSDHLIINNIGTAYSKPTIDIEGTGIVDIYLNDEQIFEIDLTTQNEIIIDTEKMEAYTPDNLLANRLVTGDYSNFKLAPGENDLRFSGDLTKATVTRYIRWI